MGRPTNHSFSHNTRVNGLSCGIRMCAKLSFIVSQITRLSDGQTDSRTNGQTAFSWLDRAACNACIAVQTRVVIMNCCCSTVKKDFKNSAHVLKDISVGRVETSTEANKHEAEYIKTVGYKRWNWTGFSQRPWSMIGFLDSFLRFSTLTRQMSGTDR